MVWPAAGPGRRGPSSCLYLLLLYYNLFTMYLYCYLLFVYSNVFIIVYLLSFIIIIYIAICYLFIIMVRPCPQTPGIPDARARSSLLFMDTELSL